MEPLGSLASFGKGAGLPKSAIDSEGDTPCVHYGELFTQYPAQAKTVRSRTWDWSGSVKTRADDVLMPTSDVTPRGLATATAIRDDGVIVGGDALVIRPDASKVSSGFLAYLIRHSRREVLNLVTGSTVYHLYASEMRKFPVRLPPLAEQQRIAEVLSDVDDLLESLDNVIAKKRAVKEAAMGDLLTGRRRLPGFGTGTGTGHKITEVGEIPADWDVVTIGSVLRVRHGRSQKHVEVQGGEYPILATGGEIGRTNTPIFGGPSVLIGRKGTIDRPQFQDGPFWTVDTLFFTEVFGADPRFMFYAFQRIDWRAYNEASGVPSLNAATIEAIPLALPSLPEQAMISEVIKEIDGATDALAEQRVKVSGVKSALMDELLTGKTRLL